MGRFLRILIWTFCILCVLYAVLSVRPYSVSGDSMNPNFHDGQIVLIDRLSLHFLPLNQWEVIVYRDMTNNGEVKLKRILGLPNETVDIADGKVLKGGKEIDEPYLAEHVHTCIPGACTDLSSHTFPVPPLSYFVLGDNRGVSRDSRGCHDIADCQNQKAAYVPQIEILGRVFFTW